MQFATLCIVVLLPMVPAILLFKLLPENKAEVGGKLQGLDLKLKGGFAGYFAVVLLILANHSSLFPPMPVPVQPYQVWYVTGHVTDEDGSAIKDLEPNDILITPASLTTQSTAGVFELTAYSSPDPGGSTTIYPELYIGPSPDKYVPVQAIPLDPSYKPPANAPWSVQIDGHQINLQVKVKRLSPYPENLQPWDASGAAAVTPTTGGH